MPILKKILNKSNIQNNRSNLPLLLLFGVVMTITLVSVNNRISSDNGNVEGDKTSDGIYTETISDGDKVSEVTKEIKDGKIYINIKTYDSSGNLIREKNTVKDYETPTKDATPIIVEKDSVENNTDVQDQKAEETNTWSSSAG